MLAYAESLFGPYPFESFGATVTGEQLGLALETQTLPIYGALRDGRTIPVPPEHLEMHELTLFHELAHQWFGNSVSIERWSDIWLNEGFTLYAELLWIEHTQGTEARDRWLRSLYPPGRPVLTADPGSTQLFSPTAVYARGALTLHALRHAVGDDAFFAILQSWTARYRHANASTADFIATAEDVSGHDLDTFFRDWLFDRSAPPVPTTATTPPPSTAPR